jgi:hypothetical protein
MAAWSDAAWTGWVGGFLFSPQTPLRKTPPPVIFANRAGEGRR